MRPEAASAAALEPRGTFFEVRDRAAARVRCVRRERLRRRRAGPAVWRELGRGLAPAGVAYGVLVWGFAMYWLALAVTLTVRATRRHLPFNLSWWAFTFPAGVLAAGTDALYGQTHAHIFGLSSLALLALLAAMWTLVATKTVRRAFRTTAATMLPVRSTPLSSMSEAA